jgi:hypothetical protein
VRVFTCACGKVQAGSFRALVFFSSQATSTLRLINASRSALDKIKDASLKTKMKPFKWPLLLFTIVGTLLSSCTSSTPIVSHTGLLMTPETKVATAALTPSPELLCPTTLATSVSGTSQVLLIDEAPQDCFPTDAAKITAVTLERNILKINVTYQGRCQEHTFGLHAETAFLQSNPPQWSLYLSHDAHGDICTENVEKLLSFDLTPMDKDRTERHAHPLLLRIIEPAGGSFADEP